MIERLAPLHYFIVSMMACITLRAFLVPYASRSSC